MSIDFNAFCPNIDSFHPNSKVWVYFSDRKFSQEESKEIQLKLDQFCIQWKSHGSDVSSRGYLALNRIIILAADETQSGVSGCSTDSSVRFIKSLEMEHLTNLMSREYIYFLGENDMVESYPILSIQDLNPSSTMVFNPFFKNLDELRNQWLMPLEKSKYKNLI